MSVHPTISDVALALATRRSEPTSSVKITRNAKGDIQYEVDVTATTAQEAFDVAATVEAQLSELYPRAENGNGAA